MNHPTPSYTGVVPPVVTPLHEDGTGKWYQRNDERTLRAAREIVDRGLALPDIPGDQRVELEELGTRIDRAITPWPIF